MARPRTFDRDEVLDRALATFEAVGYEAASLQALVEATGLSRSSLYAEFRSKHGLYLAALDRYRARGGVALDALFAAAPTALAGIEAYFRRIVAEASDGAAPPGAGCFVTNAAVEVGSRDAATVRRTRASLDGMVGAFERQIARAQAEGDVPADADAAARARSAVATVYGLRAMGKAGAARALVADVARREVERIRR